MTDWKLVPVEPTRAMIDAGHMHTMRADEEDPYRARGEAIACYSDMLAAAPSSPVESREAKERVLAFVDEYVKRRGLDPEIITSLGTAGDAIPLNVSDIRAALAALSPAPIEPAQAEPSDDQIRKIAASFVITHRTPLGPYQAIADPVGFARAVLALRPAPVAEPAQQGKNWYRHHIAVEKAALQMVRNALRTDAENGRTVRAEMLEMLDAATHELVTPQSGQGTKAEAQLKTGESCAPDLAQHNGVKTHERRSEEGNCGPGEESGERREATRGDATGAGSIERGAGLGDIAGSRKAIEGEARPLEGVAQDERSKFESAFPRFDLRPTTLRVGHYADLRVEFMWEAWQAGHDLGTNVGRYVGTVQLHDGALVFHVFEDAAS